VAFPVVGQLFWSNMARVAFVDQLEGKSLLGQCLLGDLGSQVEQDQLTERKAAAQVGSKFVENCFSVILGANRL